MRCVHASDMVTRMEDNRESDLIASITPYVMASLGRARFFEKLDDLLSPKDDSRPAECGGDYKLSESILGPAGYDSEDLQDIYDVLRSQGGCCDCEILYNVAEASSLKANYWRSRAHDPNLPPRR